MRRDFHERIFSKYIYDLVLRPEHVSHVHTRYARLGDGLGDAHITRIAKTRTRAPVRTRNTYIDSFSGRKKILQIHNLLYLSKNSKRFLYAVFVKKWQLKNLNVRIACNVGIHAVQATRIFDIFFLQNSPIFMKYSTVLWDGLWYKVKSWQILAASAVYIYCSYRFTT